MHLVLLDFVVRGSVGEASYYDLRNACTHYPTDEKYR